MKTTVIYICVIFFCWVIAVPPAPVRAGETGQGPPSIAQLEKEAQKASGPERLTLLLELADRLRQSEPDQGFTYAREARAMARQLNLPNPLFRALNRIGGWYYINEQYKEAVEFYLEALELEPRIEKKRLVSNLLVNIGMVYWKLDDFSRAEQYHRRSLELLQTSPHTAFDMGFALNNLGLVLYEQDKAAEALGLHHRALELFQQTGNKRQMAAALTNISNDLNKTGNHTEAISYMVRARDLYRQAGHRWGEANANLGIAVLYKKLGDLSSAFPNLQTALAKARVIRARDILELVYRELSLVYKKRGLYEQALDYYFKYANIKKELKEERKKKQKAVMETIYQTGKKDTQLNMLKKKAERDNMYRWFLLVAGVLSLGLIVAALLRFHTGKKLNRRLSLSEKRFRILFSYAGDAILVARQGRLIDCNQKALDMFGCSREDIMNKTPVDFSPPSQPDGRHSLQAIKSYVRDAMRGKPQRFYWKHMKKDGSLFDTMISLSMLPLEDGPYLQSIVHDISERKRLEAEKIKSAKLETAGLLAHSLARDVNYLVAVMHRNMDAVKTKLSPGDPVTGLIRPVVDAIRSLEDLSKKFLTIAEGGFLPKKKSVLSVLIRQTVQSECIALARCDLDIVPDLWPVTCDEHQIGQMLTALMRNAADALSNLEGQGHIRVTAANLERDGHTWISIEIADNGKGIPAEILPKIFDPYFTTRADVTRKGLGMGLALAQSIARRHGGSIEVKANPGKGSTFRILLPSGEGDSR